VVTHRRGFLAPADFRLRCMSAGVMLDFRSEGLLCFKGLRGSENPRVGGSNPPLGTIQILFYCNDLAAHGPVDSEPCRVPNARVRDKAFSMKYNGWRQVRATRTRQQWST
jgi:hypothetical protein